MYEEEIEIINPDRTIVRFRFGEKHMDTIIVSIRKGKLLIEGLKPLLIECHASNMLYIKSDSE